MERLASNRFLLLILASFFTFGASLRFSGSSFFGLGLLMAASLSISTGRAGFSTFAGAASGCDGGKASSPVPEGFFITIGFVGIGGLHRSCLASAGLCTVVLVGSLEKSGFLVSYARIPLSSDF